TRHGKLTDAAAGELKVRLDGAVQRTLRRQVREYVRFTNRRSIVEDFTPSSDEQALYDDVSEYLRRHDDPLLTLVYRKLLASSSFALAPTLEKLAESVEFVPEEAAAFEEEREEWGPGGKL